jgi:hypothetical protein
VYNSCPTVSAEELPLSDDSGVPACQQIWSKKLADGGVAVLFVNFDVNAATVKCHTSCMQAIGFAKVTVVFPCVTHEVQLVR